MLSGYQVFRGSEKVTDKTIEGEFHIIGKRGAHYITFRWHGESTVQFKRAKDGVFVSLKGNSRLPIGILEKAALEAERAGA